MERRARYETDGCATLPNPLPRGARAAWIEGAAENTAAFQSAGYDYSRTHASFLWKLDGAETFLNGCEEREVRGGAMRMRSWTGKNCVAEDPNNAFGCYWRYDAQAFEGCGCVVAAGGDVPVRSRRRRDRIRVQDRHRFPRRAHVSFHRGRSEHVARSRRRRRDVLRVLALGVRASLESDARQAKAAQVRSAIQKYTFHPSLGFNL